MFESCWSIVDNRLIERKVSSDAQFLRIQGTVWPIGVVVFRSVVGHGRGTRWELWDHKNSHLVAGTAG